MEIAIKSLDIKNFKGIHSIHFVFHSGMNSIYGENGTCKTTVYDALVWLLFGKDSHGNTNFEIKPNGSADGVMPEVTAVLSVNGEELQLRKTLREKWERPRGSAVARFAGNTVDYTVDDVPRKESEYKRIIAGYIDEKIFRLLTDVYAVSLKMPWKERRALLAEVCGLPEDVELLAGAPQFVELAAQVGRRTVDDYKAALMEQRKGANATLNTLPIRIDECERSVSDLAALPFEQARQTSEALQKDQERVQVDLAKLDGDALLAKAENERGALNNQLRELENENRAHRDSQYVPCEDETPTLRQAVRDAQNTLDAAVKECNELRDRIGGGEKRLDEYRARWREIDKEQFTGDRCPTCGQALPEVKLLDAKQQFVTRKTGRLSALLEDSKLLKADIAALKDRLQQKEDSLPCLRAAYTTAEQALKEYVAPAAPVIEDLPDYKRRKDAIQRSIDDVCRRIERLRTDKQAERDRLESEYREITAKIKENNDVLSEEKHLADTRRRLAELQEEQRRCAAQVEEMDRMIEMCEEFARYRVQSINDSINRKFRLTRFRLFREQINGGLADCCDVTDINGIPLETNVNDAMKVNIGLDIINTLSAHYGVRVPLFIDNAESVTHLHEIDTQIVRLVVSERDKELRLE